MKENTRKNIQPNLGVLCDWDSFGITFVRINYNSCGVWLMYCKSGYGGMIDYVVVWWHKYKVILNVQNTIMPLDCIDILLLLDT